MKTPAAAACEFVDNSAVVCALFDALINAETRGLKIEGKRPDQSDLRAELRTAFRHYGEELLAEVEGSVGKIRTELKYQPEDIA